jgi:hypothetical protein
VDKTARSPAAAETSPGRSKNVTREPPDLSRRGLTPPLAKD